MKKISVLMAFAALAAIGARADSFSDLRAKATPNGALIAKGTRIEGIVTSDYRSLNMGQNPQIAWNKTDTRMTYCTGYIQNEDASAGFRLIFKDLYDNRIPAGSRVRLDLSGCEVQREDNPERYTISGIAAEAVTILGQSEPAVKIRHIGELTPADLYTFVTLDGVEFLSKEGSYTNVREFYVQSTYINYFKKPADSDWFDEAGLYVKDDMGESLFLPVNSVCAWRRRGDRMPSGVGRVSGILVSETLRRSGLPGPYQLRIRGVDDVDIPMDGGSSYETIAEWNWDRNYYYALKCENGLKKWLERLRIDCDRVAPDAGEGWLGITVPGKMGLEKDYNSRCARDGLVAGEGNRECAAIVYDTKALDWFQNGAAVLVEASTKGFSGKALSFDFTWLAGYGTAESSAGFPAVWNVAYSIDGKSYIPVQQNFLLRPLAWTDSPVSYDAAVGYTENTVLLPALLLGRDRIFIRIMPAGRVAAAIHSDPSESIANGRPDPESKFALRIGKISLKALK